MTARRSIRATQAAVDTPIATSAEQSPRGPAVALAPPEAAPEQTGPATPLPGKGRTSMHKRRVPGADPF